MSLSPLLFIAALLFTKVHSSENFKFMKTIKILSFQLTGFLTSSELKSYAKAGAVAEEVFTGIRTVFAFNGAKV